MTDPAILSSESDARFIAQSGVTHKLDPNNPLDKPWIKVWLDINAKVKAEDAAGKLVLSHTDPAVAQHLAYAQAAHEDAAAHLDAAAAAPDPATARPHIATAAAATQASAQKTHEAAQLQPPTISPQLAHEAAQEVVQIPPASSRDHLAHAHAHRHLHGQAPGAPGVAAPAPDAVPASHSRDMLNKETDARFIGQSGRIGKLDPHNPADAPLIAIWLDIFKKVKAEDDAGRLVLTYNHPVVAQHLADAKVANQAAAIHLDVAAASPDPQTQQQHAAAASVATQVATQKTRAAGKLQPPTISMPLAHEAAHYAAVAPPNPAHTAQDHLAREQAKAAGRRAFEVHQHHHKHRRRVKSSVRPQNIQAYRTQAATIAHGAGAPFVLVVQHPDGTPEQRTFGSRAELDAAYAQLADQHDQYKYVAAFDLAADASTPIHDSVGVPAAEHADVPPETAAAGSADGGPAPGSGSGDAGPTGAPTDDEGKWSFGKIAAIAAGVIVAGGIVYVATRKKKPAPKTASRAPKVLVASGVTPARALRS